MQAPGFDTALLGRALLRRKFGAKRRIAQGGLCPPEHHNTEGWSDQRERNPKQKTAKAVFCFGAGGGTRTPTLSPAADFESATSTNSITPAGAENIIHNISPLGKSENEIRSYN